MKLAACLIVKNEEANFERIHGCLADHVDRVFVYDTGSEDGTVALARKCGATVVEGEWRNDFGWARNQSYGLAEGYDWVVYADADDTIVGAEHLRGLAADALPHITGFKFPYLNTWGSHQVDYHTLRLTRANRYVWRWPLHEQLVPVGESHEVESDEVTWSQVHSLQDRQAHTQRNLDFLQGYAEDHDLDDWLASAIVLTLIEQGRAREAYKWLVEHDYVMEITKRS